MVVGGGSGRAGMVLHCCVLLGASMLKLGALFQ
jgi:hypothetical protein